MEDEPVEIVPDFGRVTPRIIKSENIGATGVARLVPDEGEDHIGALGEIRDVMDEHYGDRIQEPAGENEEVVIERAVFRADDLPHIEYRIIDTGDE